MKARISKTMVILLHGFALKTSFYNSLIETVKRTFDDPILIVPKMKLSLFSCADPMDIVNDLLKIIQKNWDILDLDSKQSLKIILIGHSTGALLARKLYVIACGENTDAPFENSFSGDNSYEWAKNVEKIILFAGINRGWSIRPHFSPWLSFIFKLGILIGNVFQLFGKRPIAFNTRKGQSFITQLRIQTLSMYKHVNSKKIGNALTIQLLGTIDSIVAPDDDVDLITGNEFIYLDVRNSGHLNIIDFKGEYGKDRETKFIKALTLNKVQLGKLGVVPSDQTKIKREHGITDVVFVVHGIRDTGYWTQKIARIVKQMGDEIDVEGGRKFATETSSYGYFPILAFLLPYSRMNKVSWLMEQYIENLAMYPEAKFSFIGHSNGTYLLAKALKDYPSIKFNNIILAGSVVQTNFNWKKYIETGRISNIYNFIANNDLIVGIFPKAFQALELQDLGSGGFDGFKYLSSGDQFKYVKGCHSAAIKEILWDEICYYIINGRPSATFKIEKVKRTRLVSIISLLSPFILALLIGLIVFIGYLVFKITCQQPTRFIYVSIYVYIVWKGLTKF